MKMAGLRASRTQLGFLGWLAERGPTPVSKLAEWADVSQPAASRALSLLVTEGLVESSTDGSDGRVNLMRLTPKGMRARSRVLDLMIRYESRCDRQYDRALTRLLAAQKRRKES